MRSKFENAVSFIGLSCLVIVSLGTLFRLLHCPGSGALLVFGCSITAFPYIVLYGISKMIAYPHSAAMECLHLMRRFY